MTAVCPPRIISHPERVAMTARRRQHDLVEDLEWLLRFNPGEAALLQAAGVKPDTLKRQLARIGRTDLIPRIFTWGATETERRMNR